MCTYLIKTSNPLEKNPFLHELLPCFLYFYLNNKTLFEINLPDTMWKREHKQTLAKHINTWLK